MVRAAADRCRKAAFNLTQILTKMDGCAAELKLSLAPCIYAAAKYRAFHEQCAYNLVNLVEFAIDQTLFCFVRSSREPESKDRCREIIR